MAAQRNVIQCLWNSEHCRHVPGGASHLQQVETCLKFVRQSSAAAIIDS